MNRAAIELAAAAQQAREAAASLTIRRQGDVFDELVAYGATVHVEVLSQADPDDPPADRYAHVWMRVQTDAGEAIVSFYSDAPITFVVESEPQPSAPPPDRSPR